MGLNGRLERSNEYVTWCSVVEKVEKFPIEKLSNRVTKTIKQRQTTKLNIKSSNAQTITQVSMQDVAARATLTQMLIDAKKAYYYMEYANHTLRDYLLANNMIEGRNETVRKSIANTILHDGIELERGIKQLIESIEYWVTDIDKTHWQLRLQLDGITAASRPEISL